MYWGVYWYWWIFWAIVIFVIVGGFSSRGGRVRRPSGREIALAELKRRYAAGEITTQEYEERKDRIIHDHAA